MKDVYSPLEIDEQWDQRAPMIEGDTAAQAVTAAPEGAVATMGERPAGEPDPTLGVGAAYGAAPAEVGAQDAEQPAENAYGAPQPAQMVTAPAPEGQMEPVAAGDEQALAQIGGSAPVEDSGNSDVTVPVGMPHISPEPPAGEQAVAVQAEGVTDSPNAQPAEAVDKPIVEPVEKFEPAEPRDQGGDDEPTEPTIDPAELDRNIAEAEAALPKSGAELETSPVKADYEKDKEPKEGKLKKTKLDKREAEEIQRLTDLIVEIDSEIKGLEDEYSDEEAKKVAIEKKMADLRAQINYKKDSKRKFERSKQPLESRT